MRVYILTDLEGVSGVVDIAYMDTAGDFYRAARELLTADVNAAAAGCFDAGARHVVVRDGHFTGNNIDTLALDERVVLDKAGAGPWTGLLDESFDATLMVGMHAMAGTPDGFLDHTQSSASWFRYTINGRECGEIAQWATSAGHFGVPLAYVSGDRAACDEAEALIPGIVTTAVKRGVGRNRAAGMAPAAAHDAIRRDVAAALSRDRLPRPLTWPRPMTVRLTLYRSDQADGFAERLGSAARRVDARTIEKRTGSQLDILVR
jgi:D-amino peptidase